MAGNNFCEGEVADQTGKGDGAEPGTTVWTMSMGERTPKKSHDAIYSYFMNTILQVT